MAAYKLFLCPFRFTFRFYIENVFLSNFFRLDVTSHYITWDAIVKFSVKVALHFCSRLNSASISAVRCFHTLKHDFVMKDKLDQIDSLSRIELSEKQLGVTDFSCSVVGELPCSGGTARSETPIFFGKLLPKVLISSCGPSNFYPFRLSFWQVANSSPFSFISQTIFLYDKQSCD